MSLDAETNAKILKQVEFYFSDVNVAKDNFLKSKMAESAEGYVTITTLLTFKRLAALVEKVDAAEKEKAVAAALKDSAALAVDEAVLAVRRREALPESVATEEATLYAKPLPPTWTLEELQAYFGEHGTVRAIWRRPLPGAKASSGSAAYKDSVFVVFDSKEPVLRLTAAPPKAPGSEELLTCMPKDKYLESKAGEKKSSTTAQRDAKPAAPVPRTPPMPLNASATFSGCGKLEGFKAVKSLWQPDMAAGIRYVSLKPDAEEFTVIFQDAATADRMIADVAEKGTTLNGKVPTVTRLAEAEDKAATEAAEKEISDRAASKPAGGGRGGRGGGFRGGRGGGRGGRGGGRGGARRPRD